MASKISILNTLTNTVEHIIPLLTKYGIYLYIEYRDAGKASYVLYNQDETEIRISENYYCFFLSTILVDTSKEVSFYSEELFGHTIEGTGGRENGNDIELTTLRMISKTPEKEIKSFFNAVLNVLKKDTNYEKGVYSGSGTFYKDIFYVKSMVENKVFWFDFKRKDKAIKILK